MSDLILTTSDPLTATTEFYIPLECDHSYDNLIEVLKWVIQVAYMIPGIIVNFIVVYTIFVLEKDQYKGNSFFLLFTVDCFISFYLLLGEMLTIRAFLFIPPLCDIIGQPLNRSQFLMTLIIVIGNHGRAAKSVGQIFLALNRMTCVLIPARHQIIWKNFGKLGVVLIFLLPFLVVWNLIISKLFVTNAWGGFDLSYKKRVSWASLSQFHLIFISIALVVTVVCTLFTLYGLYILPYRVKSAEKSLCLATITISIGFLFTAAIQFLFAFCEICHSSDFLFAISLMCFDILHVGSPIVMLIISPQLRGHVMREKKMFSVTVAPASERVSSKST